MNFARQVRVICEPAYAEPSRGGRPGIDPVVYLKMLMIDFFENLPGDRAIAARCEDRLSARSFLGYSIQEATPDRSSFTVIRDRLSIGQLDGIHHVLLSAMHTHGLLKGRKLGIDSSVIKANASLRALSRAMIALRLSRISGVRSVIPVSIEALASNSSSMLMVVRMVCTKW